MKITSNGLYVATVKKCHLSGSKCPSHICRKQIIRPITAVLRDSLLCGWAVCL